jgi:hypothetical protein
MTVYYLGWIISLDWYVRILIYKYFYAKVFHIDPSELLTADVGR